MPLDKKKILCILDELPRQIQITGAEHASRMPCIMYIGGGSSLSLRELRDITSDLDIYVTDRNDAAWNICQDMPGIIERTSAALGYFADTQKQAPYNFHDKDTPQQWEAAQAKEMQSYFFDPAPASISTAEKTVWLAKREFVLMQKLNIMMDYGHHSFRRETGKLEQDKMDARRLCDSLEITTADDLDITVKALISDVEKRHPAFLERFAQTLRSAVKDGGDLKNAWLLIHNSPDAVPPINEYNGPERRDLKIAGATRRAQP